MHSLRNKDDLETFFQRLNAPLRPMPQAQRAELHLEVRQHLDGLTAAYEELGLSPHAAQQEALRAFGDPRKIGRRMYWEWRRGQWRGLSDEMKSVLTMLGLLAVGSALLPLLILGLLMIPYLFWHWTPEVWPFLEGLLLFGVPALAGSLVGRKRPQHAVCGAFYATISLTLLPWVTSLVTIPWTRDVSVLEGISLWAGCWLASGSGAAFLSSRGRGRQGRFGLSDLRLR